MYRKQTVKTLKNYLFRFFLNITIHRLNKRFKNVNKIWINEKNKVILLELIYLKKVPKKNIEGIFFEYFFKLFVKYSKNYFKKFYVQNFFICFKIWHWKNFFGQNFKKKTHRFFTIKKVQIIFLLIFTKKLVKKWYIFFGSFVLTKNKNFLIAFQSFSLGKMWHFKVYL